MTRKETIHELGEWLEQMIQHGVPSHSAKRKALATAIALLSAEVVPQSEQYKKGFEDAKRAFLVEYARESKNMRKRNAQLEVMLNAYTAISADAEWIPCSERLPEEGQMVLTTIRGHDVIIPQDGETLEEAMERVWNEVCYVSVGFIGSDGWYGANGFPQIVHPIAWMPLPKPYREENRNESIQRVE